MNALELERFSTGTEHIRPFQGPEVGVFGPSQQAVDQLGALVRRLVCEELGRFRGRRQHAAQIEKARRMNSSSVHRSDGRMVICLSLVKTNLST